MSEGRPASESRYADFTGESRIIITEQTDQIDREWEILKEIERIDVHSAIQEAIRLIREADAEQDVLRKAEKSNIAKNALEAANKKVKEVQGDPVEVKQGIKDRVKLLLRARSEDNNLKGFYDNTSFVLKSGSIEDLEKAASFWNEAIAARRNIHNSKGIILTDLNWENGRYRRGRDQAREMEKKLRDFEKGKINDKTFNDAKKRLRRAFEGQANLKKALERAVVSAGRNRNGAAREHEQGGHR